LYFPSLRVSDNLPSFFEPAEILKGTFRSKYFKVLDLKNYLGISPSQELASFKYLIRMNSSIKTSFVFDPANNPKAMAIIEAASFDINSISILVKLFEFRNLFELLVKGERRFFVFAKTEYEGKTTQRFLFEEAKFNSPILFQ
jgi:hypothetical protein